jgi:lipopolysaccharide transport system ATP-binding protein
MPNTVIKIEHLSKMYRLGVINNGTLWQDMQTFFAIKFGKEDPHSRIGEDKYSGDKDHFWALKDISFDIKQGDRLGIIGKNGAGKSTLLKILSRITTPTEGIIKIKGKVASLLEVGTGFHGELTGRENIYLNGAILGMKKRRIDEKLDSIIEFSGIEQHIDTPVKRYSSGMYVRLAFAVAAHLDSDILIADEVLAVGDAEFQKKALGKMQDLSTGEGRTVLFVSHNMAAVRKLCRNATLLDKGELMFYGNVDETVDYYVEKNFKENTSIFFENSLTAYGNDNIRIKSFEVKPCKGKEINVESGLQFNLLFYNFKPNIMLDVNFELLTADGVTVFLLTKDLSPEKDSKVGLYSVDFHIPSNFLNTGKYKINLVFGENQAYLLLLKEDILSFEVANRLTMQGDFTQTLRGILKPSININHNFVSSQA